MAKFSATFIAVFFGMMLLATHSQGITCDTVTSSLQSCSSALQKGGQVSAGCCSGIKSLNSAANTTAARKTACQCVKNLAKSYKVSSQTISFIASKCNVNINSNMDCNKVY